MRLIKLEFYVPEDTFTTSLDSAEATMQQEQQQLRKNENVKDVLRKHKVSS